MSTRLGWTPAFASVSVLAAVAVASLWLSRQQQQKQQQRRRQEKITKREQQEQEQHQPSNDNKDNDNDNAKDNDNDNNNHNIDHELPPHVLRRLQKSKRRQEKIPLLSLKSPMYDNVRMMDPQGNMLCTISHKKAKWYLAKQLARVVVDDKENDNDDTTHPTTTTTSTTTIQLLFEPKGRSSQTSQEKSLRTYLVSPKQNVCVACGKSQHHQRHYIVPYSYRTLLPPAYKSHHAHDVCILCPDCHLLCEHAYQERMDRLEQPLLDNDDDDDVDTTLPVLIDAHLYQLRSQALALLRWKHKIPPNKVQEYERFVRQHLAKNNTNNNNNHDDDDDRNDTLVLTPSLLQQTIDEASAYKVPNPHYIPGAQRVMQSLQTHDDIRRFIIDWRRFFVETLQPRHMPQGWRIDSPVTSDKVIRQQEKGEEGESQKV